MKRFFTYMGLIILGLVLGGLSALFAAGLVNGIPVKQFSKINVNSWTSDWSIGSNAASPYIRARVAKHGLLALSKSEAVYFIRNTDDENNPLSDSCVYELSGTNQDAYWWSITLYDQLGRLPLNTDNALSIDQTSVGENTSWKAIVSSIKPKDTHNWVSSHNAGEFDFTLRIYRPSKDILNNPSGAVNTPTIRKLSCHETVL